MAKKGRVTTRAPGREVRARAPRIRTRLLWLASVVGLSVGASGCGSKATPEPAAPAVGTSTAPDAPVVHFEFDSLDDRPVSTQALLGKPAVVAFVTTWDLASQAQIDFLVPMAKHDAGAVQYVMIALQERSERELVEVYRAKLGVTFPVALADKVAIAAVGSLGDVATVPTVVVLDRKGRLVWKKVGLAKNQEIREGLRGL